MFSMTASTVGPDSHALVLPPFFMKSAQPSGRKRAPFRGGTNVPLVGMKIENLRLLKGTFATLDFNKRESTTRTSHQTVDSESWPKDLHHQWKSQIYGNPMNIKEYSFWKRQGGATNLILYQRILPNRLRA